VTLTVVLGGFWLASRADHGSDTIVTRVDQFGDRVAIIRMDGAGATAAAEASRASALRWVLAAFGVGLVPIAAAAWWGAGRLSPTQPSGRRIFEDSADEASADRVRRAAENERLERLERERRRQLQDVVHELRTPLAVAATNLDLASTTPGLGDEVAARLAAARRGVERLARTVDDLSAHGHLTVGEDNGVIDLVVEMTALAAEQAGPARLRRLSLRVLGPKRLLVGADRSAVLTAVGNLVANAVRLAPAGSVIELGSGSLEDWAWIAVRDEGPGLAPDDHERAFHRYWRGRYDTDRALGEGLDGDAARGLGLTIARQVTEAQGGHVTVDSSVGVGSTFVVWLPRTPDARTERILAADGVHHLVDPMPARTVLTATPAPIAPLTTPASSAPTAPVPS
jgi:signal transduction histidine kinase